MTSVTVSPKFQVVIPKEVREKMRIKPGQKFEVVQIGDIIRLIPIEPMRKSRGSLKGMPTEIDPG